MSSMRKLRSTKEIDAFLARLARRAGSVSPDIINRTSAILKDVQKNGDAALLKYTRRFDGHTEINLKKARINKAANKADRETIKALELSAKRIERFHAKQKEASWTVSEPGIRLGQIIRPLDRVGVYVPGGKAVYPSTVLMNVIPAQVAGVPSIALTVPAPGGELNPYVMAAIKIVGVDEVYAVGGAQAVGALAYGTRTIKPVSKICGPGNIYVATAKRMVFGTVDIDMIAGPSEILVMADSSADPSFVAADLLSQAEHDELASSVLVTDSEKLADAVDAEIRKQAASLARRKIISASLRNYGAAIIVRSMDEAVDIANRIAPEHLEVMVRSPRKLLKVLRNAGAIFLGQWCPEPMGDYSAGPNHTLPTGATASWASPLGVYDFIKRTSLLEIDRAGFARLAAPVRLIAEREGLGAHAASVAVRQKKLK